MCSHQPQQIDSLCHFCAAFDQAGYDSKLGLPWHARGPRGPRSCVKVAFGWGSTRQSKMACWNKDIFCWNVTSTYKYLRADIEYLISTDIHIMIYTYII